MAFLKFIFLLLIALPFAIFLLFILDKVMDEFKNVKTVKKENLSPVSTGKIHNRNYSRTHGIKDGTSSVDKLRKDSAVKRERDDSKRKRRKERKKKKKAEKGNE